MCLLVSQLCCTNALRCAFFMFYLERELELKAEVFVLEYKTYKPFIILVKFSGSYEVCQGVSADVDSLCFWNSDVKVQLGQCILSGASVYEYSSEFRAWQLCQVKAAPPGVQMHLQAPPMGSAAWPQLPAPVPSPKRQCFPLFQSSWCIGTPLF